LNLAVSKDQQIEISKFIHSNLYDLTTILSDMRREMILVLKINGFLRSIDRRIGNPLNNINIMVYFIIYSNYILAIYSFLIF